MGKKHQKQPAPDPEELEEIKEEGKKRPRSIPDVSDLYWNNLQKFRRKHNLTWDEACKQFYLYQNGLDYIFSAPRNLTKAMRLDLNTVMALATEWIDAARANWTVIHSRGSIRQLLDTDIKDSPCIAIGAGPSLQLRNSLAQIKQSKFQEEGYVIATLHALKWCLEAGVVPDFTMCMDSNDKMLPFIDHDIVRQHVKDITLLGSCSMNPAMLRSWVEWGGGKMYFCQTQANQILIPNFDTFMSVLLPDFPVVDSGGNAGTSCMTVMAGLDANPVALVGIDFGYPKGHPYDQSMYYGAYIRSVGKEYKDVQDMIEKVYKDFHHPVFGTDYYYDFVYGVFRRSLHEIAKEYKMKFGHKLFNCTEGGTVYSPEAIECVPLSEFLTLVESGKYKEIQHRNPEYGKVVQETPTEVEIQEV